MLDRSPDEQLLTIAADLHCGKAGSAIMRAIPHVVRDAAWSRPRLALRPPRCARARRTAGRAQRFAPSTTSVEMACCFSILLVIIPISI
jgi:hypothetical protein